MLLDFPNEMLIINNNTNYYFLVTVTVNERTGVDNVKCMAFCFELNKKKYFLVVNGDQLGFEVICSCIIKMCD